MSESFLTLASLIEWLRHSRVQRWVLGGLLVAAAIVFFQEVGHDGDFGAYLLVGRLVLEGKHIYTGAPEGLNTWPPFFSLLCVPLALVDGLSPLLSRGLWLLLNLFLVAAIMGLLARVIYGRGFGFRPESQNLSLASPEILIPLLLSSRYVISNFDHLQINILLFYVTLGGMVLQATRHEIAGGIAIGCAAAIKVMPALFIPYLLYRRRWRAAGFATLAAVSFSLSPILFFGWTRFLDYLSAWRQALERGWSVGKMNQSVYAMLDRLVGHGIAPVMGQGVNALPRSGDIGVVAILAITVVAFSALALWVFRTPSSHERWAALSEWSVVFIASVIFGPVAWKAYFVVLLLPNALLFAAILSPSIDAATRRTLAILLSVSFVLGGLMSQGIVGKKLSWAMDMTSVVTVSALIQMIAALFLRWRLVSQSGSGALGWEEIDGRRLNDR